MSFKGKRMVAPEKSDQIRVFCHGCGRRTNNIILEKHEVRSHPDEPFSWGANHFFCKCAGCDSITYAIESWDENDWNGEEMESSWKTYPVAEGQRTPIFDELFDSEIPRNVINIYKEVIEAYNAQLPVLTGIGLRALIEAVCADRQVSGNNLQERIDGLATKGVLTQQQAEDLHAHRFLGNVAAHEIVSAPRQELTTAIEIAEHVLRSIYVMPGLAKTVKTGRKPDKT
jgi:hypothetical protein